MNQAEQAQGAAAVDFGEKAPLVRFSAGRVAIGLGAVVVIVAVAMWLGWQALWAGVGAGLALAITKVAERITLACVKRHGDYLACPAPAPVASEQAAPSAEPTDPWRAFEDDAQRRAGRRAS